MFEELDDPAPDLRPDQALRSVRARGRTLRRRRQAATATGAGTAIALVAALVLALPGGGTTDGLIATDPRPTAEPSAVPSPTLSPRPEPTAPSAPTAVPSSAASPSPAPPTTDRSGGPKTPSAAPVPPPAAKPTPDQTAEPALELGGDDLAVTAVGAQRDQAVAALSAVLGAPQADPATDVGCVSASTEVAWPRFRVGFDASGRLSGWASTDPDLTTPSGVGVGTTVARLQQVYGDRLQLSTSDLEDGDTYTVTGVQMLGSLTGTTPTDRVTALRNGSCTGP